MDAKMENNRAIAMMEKAAEGRYGIAAVVCYTLESIHATIRAAERKRSPAMILLFPWSITTFGASFISYISQLCRSAQVPVTLHLDHATSPDLIRQAADIPSTFPTPSTHPSTAPAVPAAFDSIMVDMSHAPTPSANLAQTASLTQYCHARGIATEAEPGRIEGGEDGLVDPSAADLAGLLTSPADALDFAATGIDWLAPSFGNVHGEYGARGIRLDWERLRGVRDVLDGREGRKVRLVLHGTDGFDRRLFGECVEAGLVKVNVNRVVNGAYLDLLAGELGAGEGKRMAVTGLMERGMEVMQVVVERLMDELGSSGKA